MKSYGVTIHSNETPLTVLSCGRYYLYEIFDSSWILILGTLGSKRVKSNPLVNLRIETGFAGYYDIQGLLS